MSTFYRWKNGDTWRKVAYMYYGDSRQWRRLLELNRSYSVQEHPAEGIRIKVDENESPAPPIDPPVTNPESSRGRLRQTPSTLDLRPQQSEQYPAPQGFDFWPWSDKRSALERMVRYPFQSLLKPTNPNGLGVEDVGD